MLSCQQAAVLYIKIVVLRELEMISYNVVELTMCLKQKRIKHILPHCQTWCLHYPERTPPPLTAWSEIRGPQAAGLGQR